MEPWCAELTKGRGARILLITRPQAEVGPTFRALETWPSTCAIALSVAHKAKVGGSSPSAPTHG